MELQAPKRLREVCSGHRRCCGALVWGCQSTHLGDRGSFVNPQIGFVWLVSSSFMAGAAQRALFQPARVYAFHGECYLGLYVRFPVDCFMCRTQSASGAVEESATRPFGDYAYPIAVAARHPLWM